MTDIIFVEDSFDIEKINLNQIDLGQNKIFTLNFNGDTDSTCIGLLRMLASL